MKFRSKPHEIEAEQFLYGTKTLFGGELTIQIGLDGWYVEAASGEHLPVNYGDWLVRDPRGGFYVMPPYAMEKHWQRITPTPKENAMSLMNVVQDVIDIKNAILEKNVKAGWAAEIKLQQDLFALVYAVRATGEACDPAEVAQLKAACEECHMAVDAAQATVEAGAVGKWGDGKILAFLKEILPVILQLLPLFIEPAPAG